MKSQQCRNKRAVSPVVGYVLLIGMAIALASIVTVWMKQSAKSQVENVITPAAGAAECESVNINLIFNCSIVDGSPARKLMLYNSGSLKITEVEIYTNPEPSAGNPTRYEMEMMPKTWAEIDPPAIGNPPAVKIVSGMKAELFPIISMGLENFKCQKNRVFESKVSC